jgi:RNA-directed DNA polymerase
MPAEGRSPDPTQAREGLTARRLTMSLPTPSEMVEKLQTSLQTKAKAEPTFRFYALWDKVCRQDVLLEAYRRCRANAGAAGVDGETFERIDAQGREQWLGTLREELISGRYVPKPLLRVWIPKSNGGQRPLGIPCINDRVVQMAAVLIIGPIFEADLLPQQYGFRPGLDAKMALRRVYWHVTQHGRREVVDADLRDYFTSIPHAPLLRSLSRRIADGTMLHIIKGWLTAPVVEVIDGRPVQTTEARRTKRGTPQGGVISPLLANCYFRRFLLAWHSHGHRDQLNAHVVNYADDFVICCRPGNAEAAMTRMAKLVTRLGLEVNATKTRIVRLPEEQFDFLGYTVGRFYGKDGRPYFGTRPSRKAVKSLLRRIHERTARRWYLDEPANTVARINSMLRGWCGYFDQGPVIEVYELIRAYTERRVRRWLMRRSKRRGVGFRQIPNEYLYETLGLYSVPARRVDLPRAKV